MHPCFHGTHTPASGGTTGGGVELSKLLMDLKKFKPSLTVFESITAKKNKEGEQIMALKRKRHNMVCSLPFCCAELCFFAFVFCA